MGTYPRYSLSLFTGIGGGELAAQHLLGWRTVAYVEREPYCVEVLKARIKDGWLHDAPIWNDARTFTKRNNECRRFIRSLRQMAHELVVTGGFPCQPFSNAGEQRAGDDERNGWPATLRIVREVRPRWVFLENVTGLLAGSHGYFGTVIGDLVQSGYSVAWRCLSAAELGAAHQRDRVWIVAHAEIYGCHKIGTEPTGFKWQAGNRSVVTPAESSFGWETEPGVVGVVHGIPHRVERIKALGNGQVPIVAATAWRLLSQQLIEAQAVALQQAA